MSKKPAPLNLTFDAAPGQTPPRPAEAAQLALQAARRSSASAAAAAAAEMDAEARAFADTVPAFLDTMPSTRDDD
jgi:hypothetical protein